MRKIYYLPLLCTLVIYLVLFNQLSLATPPDNLIKDLTADGLKEKSSSKYTYWGFEVYKAKLYTPENVTDIQSSLGTFPLALSLTYSRDLTKKDFIESGETFIKENPNVNFPEIKPSLERMNLLYDDVREGDTYTLRFTPKEGIKLFLNDTLKGHINDDQFATAYLGIWLSKHSISSSFTNRLVK